ncbi:MAG: BPL-N domain-containing protein [Candidatus Thermoplasmatota archaeon]|nr:BPL-N domain-containing protein [Candidatus Thermoplasmatota archaeon]MDH7506248.1 BPL-N domain-containing protein [Candidatus Thermoplasmatota archaeon]
MVKIVVYNGEHSGINCASNTISILKSKYEVYPTTKINADVLNNKDIVVLPGGDGGHAYLDHFSDAEEKAIKDFVYNGGGYFGTCAGAYLGANMVYRGQGKLYSGLGVAPNVIAYAVEYEGLLRVKMAEGIVKTLAHYNGAAMKGGEVLATFNDNKTGYYGYNDIVGDKYGKGKSVLCGSHPELEPKHPEIIYQIIDYLTGSGSMVGRLMDNLDYIIFNADFNLMIKAVNSYVGTFSKVYIRKDGVKTVDYISKAKYYEMKGRWNNFKLLNGREPHWINVKSTVTPTPTIGAIQKEIQDATGITWKSLTDFASLGWKYLKYEEYYESTKTKAEAIRTIKANFKGNTTYNANHHLTNRMNCCDFTRFLMLLGAEMGYTMKKYGFYCDGYGINHAVNLVQGKEFIGRTTIINNQIVDGVLYDMSAIAESNYPINSGWCNKNKATLNPNWITPMV